MKRINQINETKEMIAGALLDLMNKKSIDDISVLEICEVAKVARVSFYRHFKVKEDVLLYLFNKCIQDNIDDLIKSENIQLADLIEIKFNILKSSPYTKTLYKSGYLNKSFDLVGENILKSINNTTNTSLDSYEIAFIRGGLDNLIGMWIETGMKDNNAKHRAICLVKSLLDKKMI